MSKETICPKCGNDSFYTKRKGPHIGLYCKKCDMWQKWIKQNKNSFKPIPIKENKIVNNEPDNDEEVPW